MAGSNNNNKAAAKTLTTGASSSPAPRMTDSLVTFPRRPRTPTAAAAASQVRGVRPSQIPVIGRSRPTTRSVTGSLPTLRAVQIQLQAGPASPIISPTRVHPSRSYSAVLTSPPPASPVTSPAASPARNSPTTVSRVPALITHFEGRRIIPSPRPAAPTGAPLAPSPPSPTSPVIRVSTMMTQAKTVEEQLAEIQAAMRERDEQLRERELHRDLQIATILQKFELIADRLGASSQPRNDEGQAGPSTSANPIPPSPIIRSSPAPEHPVNREPSVEEPGALSSGTLQEMISNAVEQKVQSEGVRSQAYTRPYSRRIQAIHMPTSYHPPKFQQFSGDGNPKQHVAHFIETCNNAGTDGDLLVKQFGRSLKGNAFDWFIELPAESIDSWEQLESEFLSCFYSTKRTVTLVELTNLKQRQGEKVIEYINRWRNLSLNCKESTSLSTQTSIDMCIRGMNWTLVYFLQSRKPRDFQELATEAHNMEILIQEKGEGKAPLTEADKKPKFVKKESKAPAKEALTTNIAEPQKITTTQNKNTGSDWKPNVNRLASTAIRQKFTLKDRQAKTYPFPDSDVPGMLEQLLEKNLLQLPEAKRAEDVGKTSDPNYCKYHRLVGHPTEKCFVLKDRILELATQGRIILETDDNTTTSHTIFVQSDSGIKTKNPRTNKKFFIPCTARRRPQPATKDKEGWEVVIRKKKPIPEAPVKIFIKGPLFVSGAIKDRWINRILLDSGSAVNILPIQTLKNVGLVANDLQASSLMIQGFNQEGQRALGKIRLELQIGDMTSHVLFHVIDARTSYNILLGIPWLHNNKVVPSTLHQCFKYYQDGEEKTVFADECPFTEAKASFADAKYYSEEKGATSSKAAPPKAVKGELTKLKNQSEEPILRYVPQSRRKKGESPFATCDREEPAEKLKALKGVATIPLPKLNNRGIVVEEKQNPPELPKTRTQGFDPNAYRMMAKAGSRLSLEQLQEKSIVAGQNLSPTQKSLQAQGYSIPSNRHGLGYQEHEPVVISGKASVNQITTKRKASTSKETRTSAFDRIGVPEPRVSAFVRLGQEENRSPNVPPEPSNEHKSKVTKKKDPEEEEAVVHHISVDEGDDPTLEDDLGEAAAIFEEGGQATIDQLKKVNLGTKDDPRPTFLSASLSVTEETDYMSLLNEYKDVFAWSYTEMPGLDPTVAIHKLAIKSGVKPIKQSQRRFRPELVPEIEKEVDKLLKADFIREVKYPSWIANIVPVKKKNGQIRVCVDFRDLNKACPKDDFPLPITELMVDATTGHEALSFMDGSSGYNQIRMDPRDEEKTALRTPKGIFCYKVMPFGLKNAGATYQRAMQTIFDDFLHKFVECYVDDVVVKTKSRGDHLRDLRAIFERLRRHQLKMNPLKCAFGVSSGKFLEFVVRHRGIEIDQTKIDAIQQMPKPKTLSELKSLQGHLAYIRRFISNLAGRYYLMKPPVLMAPTSGKPLLLYIAAQEKSLGALLAQNDDQGKERPLYYLSRTIVGAGLNYSPIEKTCLALIFAIQKLRHYLLAHSTNLISRADPLKFIMSRPMLSRRLAKWALLLSEFEINFIPQKAIKGQGLANFLVDHPIPVEWEVSESLPDEEVFYIEVLPPWRMYFDGAARKNGAGAGVLFMSPNDDLMLYSFILSHCCTNNEAEYQAIILGLGMAVEMGLSQQEIFGDSTLVIKQIIGDFEVRKDELVPYQKEAQRLLEKIPNVTLGHVPRTSNTQADALAGIAASLAQFDARPERIPICKRWVVPTLEKFSGEEEVNLVSVYAIEEEDWHQQFLDYLEQKKLPQELKARAYVRRVAPKFCLFNNTLYRRSYDGILLRCVSKEEGQTLLSEAHGGICGAHQAGPKLHLQDAIELARHCTACQLHANYIHQPPSPLHPTVASWPFEAWGMDIIGPINPKSSANHQYILTATDYFSKWAEAAAY
ncbi:hypothetical protein H6P81_006449 [Aristolochia fimbriata]|uniref:RNA-directed DNA polymerase n=1 Tax=Aristolochia fimbriata TaxID=158543 RepID=A0AAV7EXB8_ARIFI|nr:hypothetical protein H6P81_006449 [Aristolochia fimbriata]